MSSKTTQYIFIGLWFLVVSLLAIKLGRVVVLVDALTFMSRASQIFETQAYVHPFYPLGYPVLLRVVADILGDAGFAARIISLAGALFALAAVRQLTNFITDGLTDRTFVFNTSILLLTNSLFSFHAVVEGTDMIAAAVMLYAMNILVIHRKQNFFAGFIFGLAYLLRYTSLTIFPAFLIGIFLSRSFLLKDRIKNAGFFILGFFLAACPQLIASYKSTGNPFFNEQYRNVAFGMFGGGDYSRWPLTDTFHGLYDIVMQHPVELLAHVVKTFVRNVCFADDLWSLPLVVCGWYGIYIALRSSREKLRLLSMISLVAMFSYFASISLAFSAGRYLLFPLLILAAFSGIGFSAFFARTFQSYAVIILAFIQCIPFVHQLIIPLNPYWTAKTLVSDKLREDQIQSGKVLSLVMNYHDSFSKWRRPFRVLDNLADLKTDTDLTLVRETLKKDDLEYLLIDNSVLLNEDQKAALNHYFCKTFEVSPFNATLWKVCHSL